MSEQRGKAWPLADATLTNSVCMSKSTDNFVADPATDPGLGRTGFSVQAIEEGC